MPPKQPKQKEPLLVIDRPPRTAAARRLLKYAPPPEPDIEVIIMGHAEIELKSVETLTDADRSVIRECPAQLRTASVGDVAVLARGLLYATCAQMPSTRLINELDTLEIERLAGVLAARLQEM